MIIYIKPHSDNPLAFKHMKPIRVMFDPIHDRTGISESTFRCAAEYYPDEIQSIYATTFRMHVWEPVDIAFAEDMRVFTRGGFYSMDTDPKNHTCIGEIKFHDMANAIETEKLTRERESLQCTLEPPHHMPCRISYNIDKGTLKLRPIPELEVKEILSNGPATIVFWNDGTKTVVKREIDDEDDLYDAVANALAKKVFGSTSKFHRIIDKKYRTNEKGWFD